MNHFMPFYPISFRSVSVLFVHLCLGLQSYLFLPGFPLKPCHLRTWHVPFPSESSQFDGPSDVIMELSPVLHPCWAQIPYTLPYFEHLQYTFTVFEGASYTPT
jgi:hypothetical protein